MKSKVCKICGIDKPLSEYYTYKWRDTTGYIGDCKPCNLSKKNKKTVERECVHCHSLFMAAPSEVKRGWAKYCSNACFHKYVKATGIHKEEKSFAWIGDAVSYQGVHQWVRRHKGTPKLCDFCSTTDAPIYDWSNISGEYRRDLNDWQRLCRACHMAFDNHGKKTRDTKLKRYGTLDPRLVAMKAKERKNGKV